MMTSETTTTDKLESMEDVNASDHTPSSSSDSIKRIRRSRRKRTSLKMMEDSTDGDQDELQTQKPRVKRQKIEKREEEPTSKENDTSKKNSNKKKAQKSTSDGESSDSDDEESDLIEDILQSKIIAYKDFVIDDAIADQKSERKEDSETEVKYVTKYLMKPTERSFLHVFWVTKEQLLQVPKMKTQLSSFLKRNPEKWDMDETCVDEDYTQIERIVAHKKDGSLNLYLVKWKSLGYEEATWEYESEIKKLSDCEMHVNHWKERQKINIPKNPVKSKKRAISSYKPIDQSPEFKDGRTLRKYQLEGLNWLVFCYYSKRNCILGDEMGLGKTIQSLATVEYLRTSGGLSGPFLVIAPLATLRNWQREVETWTEMNAIVYTGKEEAKEVIRRFEFSQKNKNYKFHIMITNYETLLSDSTISKIKWQFTIVDEAHRLKNRASKAHINIKQIQTDQILLLTGTPLQNDLEELWSLLNFIDSEKFSDNQQFQKEYGELTEANQVTALQNVLRPYLLRRKKEDVERDLPSKEETIIEVELTSAQKQYYRAVIEKNRDFLTRGKKAVSLNLINVFMEIRKVCNHPFLIKGAEEALLKDAKLSNENDINEFMIKSSAKLLLTDKLLTKLNRDPKNKVLIFSQMLGVLDILEDFLNFRGWDYERLDGQTSGEMKQRAIDRFTNQQDCFVFLLSTRAGGVGINLTSANTVIIYDSDFNPQNDLQAQSRCHRIGQTQDVKIFRIITRNTYEKYMMEIASKKLGLEQVVLRNMHDASTTKSDTKKKGRGPRALGLEDDEIESLLKHGAYHLFTNDDDKKEIESERMLLEEDIDQILEKNSRVVKYDDTGKELSSFSKASFCLDETDAKIDIYDKDFWEKILPEYVNIETLQAKIDEGEIFQSEESQDKFINVVTKVSETADTSSSDLWLLLNNIEKNQRFSEKHREWARQAIAVVEKPRLRKRRRVVSESYTYAVEDESEKKKKKRKTAKASKDKSDANYEASSSESDEEDVEELTKLDATNSKTPPAPDKPPTPLKKQETSKRQPKPPKEPKKRATATSTPPRKKKTTKRANTVPRTDQQTQSYATADQNPRFTFHNYVPPVYDYAMPPMDHNRVGSHPDREEHHQFHHPAPPAYQHIYSPYEHQQSRSPKKSNSAPLNAINNYLMHQPNFHHPNHHHTHYHLPPPPPAMPNFPFPHHPSPYYGHPPHHQQYTESGYSFYPPIRPDAYPPGGLPPIEHLHLPPPILPPIRQQQNGSPSAAQNQKQSSSSNVIEIE